MDGIFIRRKTNIWLVLLLLCGVGFVALYVFLNTVDSEATDELLIFLIVGILCILAAIFSLLVDNSAYIHIDETTIKAKYHWFGRLDCRLDEVEFVLPQLNALTILLKNGKRHTIMGIENAWELSAYIRRQIFAIETEETDSIRQKLSQLQAARKKELLWLVGGIVLMFANVFIAVLLTGGKEMYDFNGMDWTLFTVMGIVEMLTMAGLFYVALRCGKYMLPIEQLKYRLQGAVIASEPLPSNNIVAVYIDENYTGRIVVCGFPNDEGVFYCVQELVGNLQLETVYTSEVYNDKDELPGEGFSELYRHHMTNSR